MADLSRMRILLKNIYRALPLAEKQKVYLRYLVKKRLLREIPAEGSVNIYKEKRLPRQTMADFKASAVIPNYNYARYLRERVDSILLQTYPVSEILILDDCSTDDSMQVISELQKEIRHIPLRVIVNETNSGNVFNQWEKGLREAACPFVWICEADDSCSPNFLDPIMAPMADEAVILSYCESLTIDEGNRILMNDLREWIDIFKAGHWDQSFINDGPAEVSQYLCVNNTIANVSSVVFRKLDDPAWYQELFSAARQFRLAGDWYFYVRILERGKLAYQAASLNYHRMHSQGVTLTMKREQEYREICQIQDYIGSRHELSPETRQKVRARRASVAQRLLGQTEQLGPENPVLAQTESVDKINN